MTSYRIQLSAPLQTNSNNANALAHQPPVLDASSRTLAVSHARVADFPRGYTTYGCVCGDIFSRVDALDRHILSKNKVPKADCSLCEEDDKPSKSFSRTDHLYQHLRTYHKIRAGRIPPWFGVDPSQRNPAEDSTHPQPKPQFPCPEPGCPHTGEHAYHQQSDRPDHLAAMHYTPQIDMSFQQEPRDLAVLAPTYTNNGLQQGAYSQVGQMLGEDVQQDYILPASPAGDFQAEGGFQEDFMSVENIAFQPNDDFNFDFASNFGPNL
ncbi:hypothetical protein F5Y03DRAFT_223947 [Xylaria venustula]|nr:hypothetical protein F5Y03DRAFT_223947 [Xylaria venustula]